MASQNELEEWRSFFAEAKSNIFDVINKAIAIAAADYAHEFRLRRDNIVEQVYTCQLARCVGCEGVTVAAGENDGEQRAMNDGCFINGSNEEPMEAVDDEVDEYVDILNEPVDDLLLMKNVLIDYEHQSEDDLVRCLTRLGSMEISVQDLQRTFIGMTLKPLRKHESETVSSLSRMLHKNWRDLADEELEAEQSKSDVQVEKPEEISGLKTKLKIKINPKDGNSNLPKTKTKDKLEELNSLDEKGVNNKLESSKRKLKEGYKEVENAKKQRTVQVMELRDLPEPKRAGKNSAPKPAKSKPKR